MTERKRDWLHVACAISHDWKSVGGCNAGCGPDCGCSVPVHRCARCGDHDYGENAEAAAVRRNCALQRECLGTAAL